MKGILLCTLQKALHVCTKSSYTTIACDVICQYYPDLVNTCQMARYKADVFLKWSYS